MLPANLSKLQFLPCFRPALSCTAIQLWNLPAAASSPPAKLGGRGGGMAALPSPTAGQRRKGAALLNMSNADRGAHGKHLIRALMMR